MFTNLDQSLIRQHNQELMHEARNRHLNRTLRHNRKQSPATSQRVDGTRMNTDFIETNQQRAALMTLQPRKETPPRSMKALALGLLGLGRNSYGSGPLR